MSAPLRKLPFFLPFGGCRGRCVYCHQQTITGVVQVPPPEFVRSVLSGLKEPREVCYFGGSFCRFGRETVRAYLDAIVECAPAGSRIRFSTYPSDLRDDSLREMVRGYPVACVELGVPSLDHNVLAACRREADPDEILEDLTILRDDLFYVGVQMMIGLPGQTPESSLADLERIAAVKGPLVWDLRLYPCLVIENTDLELMMRRGEFKPLSVEEAVSWGGEFLDRAVSLGFNPIRVGLQETETLAASVSGGPHHPALGEMIFSEALARRLVRQSPTGPWTEPVAETSKFTGHGKFGLQRLAMLAGLSVEETVQRLKFFPK
jgi:histone acetyltransferase (RNA polymerase elongator complex component)